MKPTFVFLSPHGRLSPAAFGQALIILVVVMMLVMIVTAYVSQGVGMFQTLLVFPYVCVFGKRLHDAGQSAWLYLAFLLGYFMLTAILTAIVLPLFSPAAAEMQTEFQNIALGGDFSGAIDALSERSLEFAQASIFTTVFSFLATNGALGYLAWRLTSDPETNQHGPPTIDARPSIF